ncbi:MAG: hypothetical protein Q4A62_03095 [Eikenella sp.]|nr:hypothetical protein [Eikenella sp.]
MIKIAESLTMQGFQRFLSSQMSFKPNFTPNMSLYVIALTKQQPEIYQIAQLIYHCEDFGCHSAFEFTDILISDPPFCALSMAVSLDDGTIDHCAISGA